MDRGGIELDALCLRVHRIKRRGGGTLCALRDLWLGFLREDGYRSCGRRSHDARRCPVEARSWRAQGFFGATDEGQESGALQAA